MNQPFVSIVIPAWNHADVLMSCMASLAAQTYKTFEVVVVDDGSTDGTQKLMEGYQAPFSFRYHRLIQNKGAAAARNEGARMVSGEYLLFLDADAELRPDAIERMVQTLEIHPEMSFVYSSFRFGWKLFSSYDFDAALLRERPYIHTTSLMRRSIFPGFDESLKKFQDWDLWLTIVDRGGKGIWIPEELFTLHVRKEGMSRWLPSVVHRIPWHRLGWMPKEIERYRYWENIVKKKHSIVTVVSRKS